MKKALLALSVAALAASTPAISAVAPAVTDLGFAPARMLMVGNSLTYYNCGLNLWVNGLVRVKINPKVSGRIATIGTSNMAQFPIAEYVDNSLQDSHNAAKYGTLQQDPLDVEVQKRFKYDFVMIQASRTGLKTQQRDAHYLKAHADAVRKAGAQPALVMTWFGKGNDLKDNQPVIDAITKMGNDNKMLVIPVGLAWKKVITEHPELELYMPDKRHPTALGSFLYAATVYASVYKRDPNEAISFEGGCEKPIKDEKIRKVLLDAAWSTAKAWYGWK